MSVPPLSGQSTLPLRTMRNRLLFVHVFVLLPRATPRRVFILDTDLPLRLLSVLAGHVRPSLYPYNSEGRQTSFLRFSQHAKCLRGYPRLHTCAAINFVGRNREYLSKMKRDISHFIRAYGKNNIQIFYRVLTTRWRSCQIIIIRKNTHVSN